MPSFQPSPSSWSRYRKAKGNKAKQKPYGDRIPVNLRTFINTFTGDDSPITEKDFTPRDLKFIATAYYKKEAANSKDEAMYENLVNNYDSNPTEGLAYELVDGKLIDTTDKQIQGFRDKLTSYKKTRGKTSITYADYGGNNIDQKSSWLKQLSASFDDNPAYRIATTLGRFNVVKDDKGNAYVKDTYDWSDPKAGTSDYFKAIPEAIKSLEGIGNLAMRALRPKSARPVNIKLPELRFGGNHGFKNTGWYGEQPGYGGFISTEISTGEGGDKDLYPLMQPYLDQKQYKRLLALNLEKDKIPQDIQDSALKWHNMRKSKNLSSFWEEGDKVYNSEDNYIFTPKSSLDGQNFMVKDL